MMLSFITDPAKKIKVWMIGDSTMCTYAPSRAPLTGWGMPFALFFDSTVIIHNRAKGGRSTRTFISESRWQSIADSLQEDDVVLIQFGHNDEAREEKYKDRYTDPGAYRQNLTRFVMDTRNKKAIPVLITPVSRMHFDKDGHALETHKEYSAVVIEVATNTNTTVIDLDKKSRELFEQFGPEKTGMLFMQLEPGETPLYPQGSKDNTHFNELGARRMAELVLAGIREQHIPLEKRIIKTDK